ncbi:D-lactaldehyde dehydrogenase [Coprinopsis sp. MPI-PUGE-AT-0042]|nr:D-lactaldehyde dehydrogenase [Coprinopsis sp. MPI-PUGE-AT-0042]
MPPISPNDKILVTGANGYIALWVIKTSLEKGYSVRAAIRAESKGERMKELFKDYGSKLELTLVPDMTKDGAWDEAVKGVQAVVHTATPVDFSNPNPKPETFIEPAIKGVVGLLESAAKNREIKRVVITSSMSAVARDNETPRLYTEEDWNDTAVKAVEEKGAEAGAYVVYSASKVLAERAAWDFYKKNQDQISWELTAIIPPLVLGPPLGVANSPTVLNGSLFMFWHAIISDTPKTREQLSDGHVLVDVRDLAAVQIRALETEKAGGERIFALNGPFTWQELLEIASGLNLPNRKLPSGFSDIEKKVKVDASKEKGLQVFGPNLKYRSKEETIKDTLERFAEDGL